MQIVTMEEARAQLPDLIEAAAKGEPFQIKRADDRLLAEPDTFRLQRLENGFKEISLLGKHVLQIAFLPKFTKIPSTAL